MFSRLKRALVESYIGAIGLGILLADVVLEFVDIFVAPVANWASLQRLRGVLPSSRPQQAFPFRDALPHLGTFVLLLCVWFLLFLWLYARPATEVPLPGGHQESARSE